MQRRPLIAAFFLLLGIPICCYLYFIETLGHMLGGMSDSASGASPGGSGFFSVPFLTYFASGVFAAFSTRMWTRRALAIIGHIVPLAAVFVIGSDIVGLLVILVVIFGFFAVGWIRLACNENSRLYQMTSVKL